MARKIPQRMCVACRTMKPKNDLIRLVLLKDGTLTVDLTGKKPGRGAYVCRDNNCIRQAVRERRFDKGLRASIRSEEIEEIIKKMEDQLDNNE